MMIRTWGRVETVVVEETGSKNVAVALLLMYTGPELRAMSIRRLRTAVRRAAISRSPGTKPLPRA